MLLRSRMSRIASPPVFQSPALPRVGGRALVELLLLCGVLSSLMYVAANVLGAMSWPGYSSVSQTISELSAIDAPSRTVFVALGLAYDVLLIAFAIGVWRSAGRRRGLRVTAALLLAIGALGFFWPPMHLRGTVTTLTDTMHVVFASVVSLFILLAVGFGAGASGRRFRLYSIATIGGLLVFGALSFREGPKVAADQPTPWLGLLERINLGLYLAWVVVLAVVLLRERRRAASTRNSSRARSPRPVDAGGGQPS